jgi:hypothetical protein
MPPHPSCGAVGRGVTRGWRAVQDHVRGAAAGGPHRSAGAAKAGSLPVALGNLTEEGE